MINEKVKTLEKLHIITWRFIAPQIHYTSKLNHNINRVKLFTKLSQ